MRRVKSRIVNARSICSSERLKSFSRPDIPRDNIAFVACGQIASECTCVCAFLPYRWQKLWAGISSAISERVTSYSCAKDSIKRLPTINDLTKRNEI